MRIHLFSTAHVATLVTAASLHAAEAPHRLTLKEAAAHALQASPSTATADSKEASAQAKVGVAKSEAAPKVFVVGQLNRSTGNVVPGATFAMPGVPGVQGPPGAERFGSGTWQSVAGVTASWDILEIIRRPTIVGAADREVSVAKAQTEVTRLEVLARTADAYLVVVEAHALQQAAEASEKRVKTFHDVVATLVGQKLRPELDLARADTDLAAARVLVEKTRLGVTVTSVRLAEGVGESSWSIEVVDADFAELPAAPPASTATHPAIVAYAEAAHAAEERASVAKLALLPKVELAGAAWLRGGGYVLGGPNSGSGGGLVPDTPNWAVGLVATWAPADIVIANAKAKSEHAEAAVQKAKAAEVQLDLSTEVKVARATLASQLAIAKETGAAVVSARRAVELANTRYTTGNGNVVEVADAERALASAERDDAIARLEAWRALVAVYRAEGDLAPLVGAPAKAKG